MLIHPGVFWEFRYVFRQKDVAVIKILRRDLSGSFVKK